MDNTWAAAIMGLGLLVFSPAGCAHTGAPARHPTQASEPRPPAAPEGEAISHGPRNLKLVALTFDACSTHAHGKFDARVIQTLVDMRVPATLFLGGKWMRDQPAAVRRVAGLPQFELGVHADLHPHLTRVSDTRVREELERAQHTLKTLTGRHAALFRPPFGEYNRDTIRLAADLGLTTVEYDLPSGDPDPNIGARRLADYVARSARNGSIIVMHMNGRGWHTAQALPEIVTRLRERGFTLVTVGQLAALNRAQARAATPAPPRP